MNKNTDSRLKDSLCKYSLKGISQYCTLLVCLSLFPSIVNADFNPILISDDNDHLIYKITGASSFADLTGENLNDGVAPDIEQVGSYPLGYNIQDLAKDSAGKTWGISQGTGSDGSTLGHLYMGEITEVSGSYSYTNITDLGYTHTDGSHKNHGKALVWDPDNQYFIYGANPTQSDTLKATFKAYDPATQSVVADPWGTGSAEIVIPLPTAQANTYPQGLSFSPDGELYASIGGYPAFILKLDRNANHKLTGAYTMIGAVGLDLAFQNIEVLSFSPDGQLMIIESNGGGSSAKGKISTVDLTTGTTTEVADLDNGYHKRRDWEGVVFNEPAYNPIRFTCDSEIFVNYVSSGSFRSGEERLATIDALDGTTKGDEKVEGVIGVTSLGYNTKDNYLWGYNMGNKEIVKIDKNYNTETYGLLGLDDELYSGADVSQDGVLHLTVNTNYYNFNNNRKRVHRIDLNGATPVRLSPIVLNQTIDALDIAFNPVDNNIYFISQAGIIYKITLSANGQTGTVSTVGDTGLGNIYTVVSGFDKNGAFYFNKTAAGTTEIWKTIFNSARTSISSVTKYKTLENTLTQGDGALCANATITEDLKISGTIFQDDNTNDTYDGIEAGLPNIAVSLYEDINNDGAIDNADNFISIASSNNDGNYSFNSLSDGDYLVQVDSADSSLASGLTLGGSNPLDVTVNGSDITDKDFPFDSSGCTALSGSINTSFTSGLQISNGDKVFLGSTTVATEAGHLKAFVVDASGIPATDASWDAADQMTPVERDARLYSTDDSGAKILFASLDDAAFDTNGLPTVTTIKNTIKTATLGALSDNSSLALIDDSKNVFTYLSDATYRSFITSNDTSRSSRTKRVLASSNDGFLYAFNQSDGDLGWGWMPRSLVDGLKDPTTFRDFHYMQGEVDVLDLKHSGSFRSYVVGSYKQGLGQYVLRLSNDTASNLDAVIWDVDHSARETSVPNQGKRAYFEDGSDASYSAYVTSGASANSSTLHIRSLTSTTALAIPLTFNATSTAYIMTDVGSTTAKSIYLGDDVGNIYSASLLDINQALKSASDIQTDINGTAVASLNTTDSSAVLYIGSSKSSTDNTFHLRAQSEDRLTIFKYDSSTSSWVRKWTTYIGGGNKWSSDGSVVADTDITALPSGANITDNAYVVANSIVLPITLEPASGQCSGLSYYYLFQLDDGHFPVNRFYTTNNTAISSTIALGKGDARTLHFTNLLGSSKMIGTGIADQTTDGGTGVGAQFLIKDPISTGIRSWKEL